MAWKCFVIGRKPRASKPPSPLECESNDTVQGIPTDVVSKSPQRSWETRDKLEAPPLGTHITSVSSFHLSPLRPSPPSHVPVLPSPPSPLAPTASVHSSRRFGSKIRSSSFDELTHSLPPPPRRPSKPRRGVKRARPTDSMPDPEEKVSPSDSLSIPDPRQNEPYSAQTPLSALQRQSPRDGPV
ncbi:hypothetical protein BS47DRAFT_1343230 [Hydnum rufescens UP504]|uniref:Uncharacterized protein n=1 Tax=Hydnum rufescens UP504 TaxID=1448309 RepID=A0A9P6AYN4_9AGAM|nr:hypothetical protein BS47DRAFT_1343230 [Hydnum rufescens UP504]